MLSQSSFQLATRQDVEVNVYNLAGQLVGQISIINLAAGVHKIEMGTSTEMSDGVYFVEVKTGKGTFLRKLVKN